MLYYREMKNNKIMSKQVDFEMIKIETDPTEISPNIVEKNHSELHKSINPLSIDEKNKENPKKAKDPLAAQ